MLKTTIYLPESLDARLEAESAAVGKSKAELIREAVTKLLDESNRPRRTAELPVFRSGRPMTVDEMDDAIHEQIQQRAARR